MTYLIQCDNVVVYIGNSLKDALEYSKKTELLVNVFHKNSAIACFSYKEYAENKKFNWCQSEIITNNIKVLQDTIKEYQDNLYELQSKSYDFNWYTDRLKSELDGYFNFCGNCSGSNEKQEYLFECIICGKEICKNCEDEVLLKQCKECSNKGEDECSSEECQANVD